MEGQPKEEGEEGGGEEEADDSAAVAVAASSSLSTTALGSRGPNRSLHASPLQATLLKRCEARERAARSRGLRWSSEKVRAESSRAERGGGGVGRGCGGGGEGGEGDDDDDGASVDGSSSPPADSCCCAPSPFFPSSTTSTGGGAPSPVSADSRDSKLFGRSADICAARRKKQIDKDSDSGLVVVVDEVQREK